jgi:acetyl esterase/lipase
MDLKPLTLVERIIIWIVTRIVLIRETVRYFQRPKNQRPTFSKSYACRPKLKNRVFLPPGLDLKLKDDKKYPLFIEIHGGGFVAGAPFIDDEYCAMLSKRCSAIVVSMNYRKSPGVQYPVPLDDCVTIAGATITDSELPIDFGERGYWWDVSGRKSGFVDCAKQEPEGKI